MTQFDPTNLPPDLLESLRHDFFIRFTTIGRTSGLPRISETTFVWDGKGSFVISGYPGKRDWIANMASNPSVTLHTVEGGVYYDIPTRAEVLTAREERAEPLIAFLDRWANRPEAPRRLFGLVVGAIRLNRKLRLPWWGPFWMVRRLFDRMPCARLVMVNAPIQRRTAPPSRSRET